MKTNRKKRPCGNRDCSTSTGIHDGLTFGGGELDSNGFWARPCRTCAAYYEAMDRAAGHSKEYMPYWPFREENVKDKKTKIVLEQGFHNTKGYKVVKLVNRVVPEVGHELKREEVQHLIKEDENLTVEILPNKKLSK